MLGHLVCASATKSLTFITDNREKTILHLQLELYKESVVQVTGWRVASVVCQVFCFFLEDDCGPSYRRYRKCQKSFCQLVDVYKCIFARLQEGHKLLRVHIFFAIVGSPCKY